RFYRGLMHRRFGIETSYRQMNQGKALTTSTDPRRRLLWLGVALLLRQAWVWCQRALAGRRSHWTHWRPPEALPPVVPLGGLGAGGGGGGGRPHRTTKEPRSPSPDNAPPRAGGGVGGLGLPPRRPPRRERRASTPGAPGLGPPFTAGRGRPRKTDVPRSPTS